MLILNSTLERLIADADGRYLDDQELQVLLDVQVFQNRSLKPLFLVGRSISAKS